MFQDKTKAIFLQIADRICDDILSGHLEAESRLPSVREYAAMVEVNPNTVMRTYDLLASREVIFNRRGIGFFVSAGAAEKVRRYRAEQFLNKDLNEVFRQLGLLGITPEDLCSRYADYLKNN